MSNTPNTQTNIDTLTDNPPAGNYGSGNNTLSPGQALPARTVKGVAKGVNAPTQQEILSSSTGGTEFQYTGQGLVNSRGILARGQYSESEAYAELAKLSTADRRAYLNALQAVGAYGNSAPSRTGFNTTDFSAMREAMLYANHKGVTLDVAITMMGAELGSSGVGGGQRIRTTPKQDLQAVFRQVSGNILGRRLSDSEVEKFVKAYNQKEVSAAYGGAEAPTVEVAAMEQVEAAAPEEAGAMGVLKLSNVIDSAIKELG
jgi:hypothetical protein